MSVNSSGLVNTKISTIKLNAPFLRHFEIGALLGTVNAHFVFMTTQALTAKGAVNIDVLTNKTAHMRH